MRVMTTMKIVKNDVDNDEDHNNYETTMMTPAVNFLHIHSIDLLGRVVGR